MPGPELPTSGRIGGYDLLERLGEGGMGIVHRARGRDGREVALKTVRRMGEAELLGLRREIRSLARLAHPGIVRILDDGVDAGCPWYAMELLEGEPLSRMRGPLSGPGRWWTRALPEARAEARPAADAPVAPAGDTMAIGSALTLARRLCAPLGYLHGEGLVHRDLKPDNILVRPDGQPVILDFGLVASVAERGSREGLVVEGFSAGTAAFMSPEQLRGELVDARADLWSLGVILYLLLTGRPPFATAAAIADPELPASPPSAARPEVSAEVDALVARLLAKERRDRFGFADQLGRSLALLGARNGTPAVARRPHVYRAALAGRTELLSGLVRHVTSRLRAREGDLIAIGGESGAGKTRLAVEVARSLELTGIAILAGTAAHGAEPLAPLAPLFRRAVALAAEEGEATRAALLGEAASILAPFLAPHAPGGGSPAAPPSRGEVGRSRVLGAVTVLLDRLARRQHAGLLLVLDDLHAADDLTLAWLEHLAATGAIGGSPVVILGTYRTEEAPERLRALLAGERVRRIVLGRLDASAVGSMAADMLAMTAPPGDLVAALVRGAGGNPLFASELLRAAVDAGSLRREDDGSWRLHGGAPAFPDALRELLAARLGALDPAASTLAGAAAVLGRSTTLDVLLSVCALPESSFLDAVRALERHGVLEAAGAGAVRFGHDKLAEVAASRIAPSEATELHRRAAERLSILDERERPWASIVEHWQRAGEAAQARAAALPAARRARASYDKVEAERLYRVHLDGATVPASPAERALACDARHELARVLYTLGRSPEAAAFWSEALPLAEALDDVPRRAACHRGLANAAATREAAEPHYARAEELARATGDPVLIGEMAHARALHLADVGERREAERLYAECVELARSSGDLNGEAVALGGLAQMWNDRGEYARGRAAHERLVQVFTDLGDVGERGIVVGNLGMGYLAEDLGRAAALLEEAAALLRRAGDVRNEPSMVGYLAVARFQLGQPDEGRRLFRTAVEAHRRTGNTRWHAMTLSQWIDQECRAGGPERARPLAAEAAAVSLEPNDIIQGFRAAALGKLQLLLDAPADAELATLSRTVDALELGDGSVLAKLARQIAAGMEARAAGQPLPEDFLSED